MKLEYLIKEAELFQGCGDGLAQLRACKTVEDMVDCYYDRIDFCIANNFPDDDFFDEHKDVLKDFDIYYNQKATITKRSRRLVVLGDSDIDINLGNWDFSRIYVKGNSKVRIRASFTSMVVIDALDNSEIIIDESTHSDAKVRVFLYDKAKCTGRAKVVNTNKKTYDL